MGAESCTDAELLQAYQEQHTTVEPGCRWIKNPAAISPVWLEKPERMAALAILTVVSLLVYAVIQRRVRLYLRDHNQHIPSNKGPTALPTAAVVFDLFTPVTLVHYVVDKVPILHVHGSGAKFAAVGHTPLNVGYSDKARYFKGSMLKASLTAYE